MPSVGAQGTSISFENFHFTVNGKHLLYEGSPEMEQAHRERAFVFRPERDCFFTKKLTEIRAQLDILGGFPLDWPRVMGFSGKGGGGGATGPTSPSSGPTTELEC